MSGSNAQILIVDDDAASLESLRRALKGASLEGVFSLATSQQAALNLLTQEDFSVAVLDLSLDQARGVESGFELLRQVVATRPSCRCIVLTGHSSSEHGIRALQLGAAHFLEKPPDIPLLAALIRDGVAQSNLRRSYEQVMNERRSELEHIIIGCSEAADKLRMEVQQAAHGNQAVLLCGETGSGKGLAALAIHRFSSRRGERFVRYQPSYSNADLVNSDLFGHVKGAFTGADRGRRGLLDEANGGTFFLDEIDELPAETQVALLGVLQDKRYRPVGTTVEHISDFRLISACNQNVQQALERGRIRSDLFHRLARLTITIPPLRERLQDIALLAVHILCRLRENERVSVFELEPAALEALHSHSWPGNVRELESVVESAAYRAQFEGRTFIERGDITTISGKLPESTAGNAFHELVENYKRRLIDEALARHGGNQVKAARDLQLDRSNMRRILGRYNR